MLQLGVKGYSTLPKGYHLLEKYNPIRFGRLFVVSILVWLFTGWLCIITNSLLRPGTNWDAFKNMIFANEPQRFVYIGYGIIIVLVYGIIHEFIHAIFHWIFSRKWQTPRIQWKTLSPYAAIAPGAYYPRNKFCISTIAPLTIVFILGLIVWLIVPLSSVPVVILVLSVNFGAAASDIPQTFWARSHLKNAYFGCEDERTVVYGP
ncbi:DUF3267 domain-containing protein [Dehalococcoides mccartyi]|uniref:DUF3267 domain-containing protein n=1 Tax=Dehalococcoides mccartyi TaxID=61435 RepID=UPI0006BC1E35|nr:DUF3267 domain-containing protein [Dehalococcoides mccartyi]BAS31232.1 hypothetical protein IBK_0157 [Dehalococcoides mccartyi IBARAKI]